MPVILATILELLLDPAAHVDAEVGGDCQVAVIEKPVHVLSQQKPI
jgi:hypothetical protein